jgi:hypothetical protein
VAVIRTAWIRKELNLFNLRNKVTVSRIYIPCGNNGKLLYTERNNELCRSACIAVGYGADG